MNIFLAVLILSFGSLMADVPTLTLQRLEGLPDHMEKASAINYLQRQMSPYHHKEVQIRGFLYQTEHGQWILASEPNLKTCCIGKASKIAQQVFVEGELPSTPSSKAITIQGIFYVDPRWNASAIVQIYRLENAKILPEGWPIASITLAGIGVSSAFLLWRFYRQTRESDNAPER